MRYLGPGVWGKSPICTRHNEAISSLCVVQIGQISSLCLVQISLIVSSTDRNCRIGHVRKSSMKPRLSFWHLQKCYEVANCPWWNKIGGLVWFPAMCHTTNSHATSFSFRIYAPPTPCVGTVFFVRVRFPSMHWKTYPHAPHTPRGLSMCQELAAMKLHVGHVWFPSMCHTTDWNVTKSSRLIRHDVAPIPRDADNTCHELVAHAPHSSFIRENFQLIPIAWDRPPPPCTQIIAERNKSSRDPWKLWGGYD